MHKLIHNIAKYIVIVHKQSKVMKSDVSSMHTVTMSFRCHHHVKGAQHQISPRRLTVVNSVISIRINLSCGKSFSAVEDSYFLKVLSVGKAGSAPKP